MCSFVTRGSHILISGSFKMFLLNCQTFLWKFNPGVVNIMAFKHQYSQIFAAKIKVPISLWFSFCLFFCLFICLFIYLFIYSFIYLLIYLFICLFVYLVFWSFAKYLIEKLRKSLDVLNLLQRESTLPRFANFMQAPDESKEGHGPQVIWSLTLPGMYSWKFAFVKFTKASKTFLAPTLPESRRGPCFGNTIWGVVSRSLSGF